MPDKVSVRSGLAVQTGHLQMEPGDHAVWNHTLQVGWWRSVKLGYLTGDNLIRCGHTKAWQKSQMEKWILLLLQAWRLVILSSTIIVQLKKNMKMPQRKAFSATALQ